MTTPDRWDRTRLRRRGVIAADRPPPKTELVRCPVPGCGAAVRQLVGAGPGWLARHTARVHSAQKEALF